MVMTRWTLLVGVGQLGGIFSHGCLRRGQTVVPITRRKRVDELGARADLASPPEMVLLTVGEDALPEVVPAIPPAWRERVVLVQNELLPDVWTGLSLTDPTVAVVWFEKKAGRPVREILPSPVSGPVAGEVVATLQELGIGAEEVTPGAPLEDSLVAKNVYVVGFNVAGLSSAAPAEATVADLFGTPGFSAVAEDVLAIQEARLGRRVDRDAILDRVREAVARDPAHGAKGRSAPARFARAIAHADAAGLAVPALRRLAEETADGA